MKVDMKLSKNKGDKGTWESEGEQGGNGWGVFLKYSICLSSLLLYIHQFKRKIFRVHCHNIQLKRDFLQRIL